MSEKRLALDSESIVFILNYILMNIEEDRRLALTHHDALNEAIDTMGGLGGGELVLLVEPFAKSIVGFLDSTSKSTDNAIKVAKLLSDYVLKIQATSQAFSDEERDQIAKTKANGRRVSHRTGNKK